MVPCGALDWRYAERRLDRGSPFLTSRAPVVSLPVAWVCRARGETDGHYPGQPHAAIDAGVEGVLGWLRRYQAYEVSKVHAAVDTLGHLLALDVTGQ